ncbi:MerR family transcriptional regulator [Candidatus Methylobacter favarea]|uniref:MerR family transcriptional regulator n=1 Tax=Candidatus Methylobacter favarea TaxID=2707345 RepID=A0A8S0XQ75_9GAMM|nr:chaperone modulator CbpM [Candidatus Methylobacter favarea]CAA9889196.1 MerR family transcriptional regulator [Candidatus Methylobacter favarea]
MKADELSLIYTGVVIEEGDLTLGQLCRSCDVSADWVISLVEESIVEPEGEDLQVWRFSGTSVRRVRSALRLQRELGVNLSGIALALDLMDEIESLRAQIKMLGEF